MKKITASVGNKGINKLADVKVIQTLLNQQKLVGFTIPLRVDGKSGPKTIYRIEAFQKNIVKMIRPDGRVDPGGKSINVLNKTPVGMATIKALKVTYSSGIPTKKQIVSNYAISVIKMALKNAGIPHAVITSTIRKPEEQAVIMYQNAVKNLSGQFKLYGPTGDKVLTVYKANKSKSKNDVIKLMTKEIEDQLKNGNKTSKHVVTEAQYKTLNIFDIGVNSSRAVCGTKFNIQKFTNALSKLKKDGYIEKLIDETKKTNSCWHVEIKPNAKIIPRAWF
jgi:peptidoglycan hydrolase-like protein with peptidoglycan-binding domain